MPTQMITGLFRLMPPIGAKKRAMDNALVEYGAAVRALCSWGMEHIDHLETSGKYQDSYSGMSVRKCLPKQADAPILYNTLRFHGAPQDAAAKLASYLALRETAPDKLNNGQPSFWGAALTDWPEYDGLLDITDYVMDGVNGPPFYEDWRDEMQSAAWLKKLERTSKAGIGESIYFPYANSRGGNMGVLLLRHEESRRLWALLYIGAKGVCPPISGDGSLVEVATGKPWVGRTTCAVLVPIQEDRCGWLESRFLVASGEGEASPQTARLYKRRDKWLLAVSFEMQCPDPYEANGEIVVEVEKGLGGFLLSGVITQEHRDKAYAIRRERAAKQRRGRDVSYDSRERAYVEEMYHHAANTLLERAKTEKTVLVMEGGGFKFKGFWDILRYKARLAGVPVKWRGRQNQQGTDSGQGDGDATGGVTITSSGADTD